MIIANKAVRSTERTETQATFLEARYNSTTQSQMSTIYRIFNSSSVCKLEKLFDLVTVRSGMIPQPGRTIYLRSTVSFTFCIRVVMTLMDLSRNTCTPGGLVKIRQTVLEISRQKLFLTYFGLV